MPGGHRYDVTFPMPWAWGATRLTGDFQTQIVTMVHGREQRENKRVRARHRYEISTPVAVLADTRELVDFHMAMGGRLYSFRFPDTDEESTEGQPLVEQDGNSAYLIPANPNGSKDTFYLGRAYEAGAGAYVYYHPILAPRAGTVTIYVDGSPQTLGADYTLDLAGGEVVFEPGSIPGGGTDLTWDGSYDIMVRFDTDPLPTIMEDYQLTLSGSVFLVEVPWDD